MLSYFENQKTISFYVLCLNFSIETKIIMALLFLVRTPSQLFSGISVLSENKIKGKTNLI